MGHWAIYILDEPITKGRSQPIGGHVSYPTDSPIATRLGLYSSLSDSSPISVFSAFSTTPISGLLKSYMA